MMSDRATHMRGFIVTLGGSGARAHPGQERMAAGVTGGTCHSGRRSRNTETGSGLF